MVIYFSDMEARNRLKIFREGEGGRDKRINMHICITNGHNNSGLKAWGGEQKWGGGGVNGVKRGHLQYFPQ